MNEYIIKEEYDALELRLIKLSKCYMGLSKNWNLSQVTS